MKQVYIVTIVTGTYSDAADKRLAAFSTHEAAALFCKTLNAKLKTLGVLDSVDSDDAYLDAMDEAMQTDAVRAFEKEIDFPLCSSGGSAYVSTAYIMGSWAFPFTVD